MADRYKIALIQDVADLKDYADTNFITEETDPVFIASPAYEILAADITNWNNAYGWGNHVYGTPAATQLAVWANATAMGGSSGLTYDGATLTITGNIHATGEISAFNTSADPSFWDSMPFATDSTVGGIIIGEGLSISEGVVSVTGGTGGDMVYPDAGIPLSTGEAWGTSITNNSNNWNTAYEWGNHVNGTPAENQIAVWVDATAMGGSSGLTYDGATLTITGNIHATGEISAFNTSADPSFWDSMPFATDSTVGGIIIGEGLSISEGVVSVTGGGSMTYPGAGIPLSTGSAWGTSITDNSANWNTAYGWGNHASAGYLTSQTSHADVVVDGNFTSNGILKRTSYGVYGIVTDNSSNWNTAYGWGNHASAGYQATLVSGTNIKTINSTSLLGSGNIDISGGSMTYPGAGIPLSTGSAWGTSITNNSANWNTAYGWGNHASAGYLTSQTSHADVVVDGDFTSNGILKRTSSGVYGIVTDNSSNWNTAYGWGNHAGSYLPIGGGTLTGSLIVQGSISASGEITAYAT